MEETNLTEIKRITKTFANLEPIPAGEDILSMFVIHPFIHDSFWYEKMCRDKSQDIEKYSFKHSHILQEWRKEFYDRIDKCNSLERLYMLWQSPWKMTFMKYCGDELGQKDYAKYLTESWITEENPNMDKNVSRREALKMFKKAEKHYLMDEEDLEHWENLPETITIWRGVSKGRVKLGLSWTDDKSKAEWFQQRFSDDDDKGKLLEVTTSKSNVIAYFNKRNEREILLDVFRVKDNIKLIG